MAGKKGGKDDDKDFNLGIMLVSLSLFFDGLTQTQTDINHKTSKRDFAYQGMFCCNLFGLVVSGAMYVYAVIINGDDTHVRVMDSSKLMFDCLMVGLSGTLG